VQAGYGLTKIISTATLPANTTGTHELTFANAFEPAWSKYQVNGFVSDSETVQLGAQERSDDQQSMTMAFTIGGAAAASADTASTQVSVGTSLAGAGHAQRLMTYFESSSNTPTALLVALAIALMLGSLHALTPGHGKTLVAAYLVGSRGTVKHAVALGAIVTFTHTSSVIAIGLIALFASHYIMPSVLVPVLEIVSGLLVVVLGARLIWSRYQTYRAQKRHEQEHALAHANGVEHSHEHVHAHVHDHTHAHDDADGVFWHDHGDGHVHSHAMPETVTARNLLAMGISGGMVPCPEALGIMIIAIGLHRIALGLGLIVSFSLGLAAVLIGIGILLVRSRMLMERFGVLGSRMTGAVIPLASAVIVTILGLGIAFGGLSNYLG
jgi:ABC-type nickel/cobalt efflux system permease component RcnA